MRLCVGVKKATIVAVAALVAGHALAHVQNKAASDRNSALRVLQRYIRLRLEDAEWKRYSKLITWPDEPSWDCKWVVNNYKLGHPIVNEQRVIVPTHYDRLGLFCYDFNFHEERKTIQIDYELVKHAAGWKVDSPIPDYPEISVDALARWLSAIARDKSQASERRKRASSTISQLVQARNHENAVP